MYENIQNFENKITEEYYNQMDKLGMTLDEVITLASIVQAEAASKDSMKMVASVFENRLAIQVIFLNLNLILQLIM